MDQANEDNQASNSSPTLSADKPHTVGSDAPFFAMFGILSAAYVSLIIAMLCADAAYMIGQGQQGDDPADGEMQSVMEWVSSHPIAVALADPDIQYSIRLSLVATTITSLLSILVAVPLGYLISRYRIPGRNLLDALLDVPFVLPPLVVGLSLLILFQYVPVALRESVVYQIPAVVLAQFVVAAAFAVRVMRATFDQINVRREHVALTLGCSRAQAFAYVVLPEAGSGVLTATALAWARALGEFGPLLVFAGATRGKTEVLSTSVFLEISIGNLEAAVAISFIMIFAAMAVLVVARTWGSRNLRL